MASLKSPIQRAKSATSGFLGAISRTLSQIGSTIKSLGSSALSSTKQAGLASVDTALGGLSGGSNKNLSSQVQSNLNQIQKQLSGGSSPADQSTPGGVLTAAGGSVIVPQLYTSGRTIGTYSPNTPGDFNQNTGNFNPIYSSPTTLGGGQKPGTTSSTILSAGIQSSPVESTLSTQSVGSISSASVAPSSPIALPSAPSINNVGQVNNGGLISALTGTGFTYNPNTNTFSEAAPANPSEEVNTKRRNLISDFLMKNIPKKENVYEDSDVKAQRDVVRQRQQEVANYTAQLNSIVAQQNADLLRLREIGSKEGVTEVVYGGQAATINREAAIKALPVQAQIAAAQGNLQLAQDYLTQLTTFKQEEINNDYQYRKEVYSTVRDFLEGNEKRRLELLDKQTDRAYEMAKTNLALLDSWMKTAVSKGQTGGVSRLAMLANNVASPNFRQQLAGVVGGITNQSSSSGVVSPDGSTTTPTVKMDKKAISALKTALNQSKFSGSEADGKYADPSLYLANYNSYPDKAEFLRNFPPKTYINPKNDWLPQEILQFVPKPKGSSGMTEEDVQKFLDGEL